MNKNGNKVCGVVQRYFWHRKYFLRGKHLFVTRLDRCVTSANQSTHRVLRCVSYHHGRYLEYNELIELPDNIFDDLTSLQWL